MYTFFHHLSFSALFAALFLVACNGAQNGQKGPDVTGIEVPLGIQRFDQDVFAIDTNNLAAAITELQTRHPNLFPLFTGTIIHDLSNPSETPDEALRNFLRSPLARMVNDSVQHTYNDVSDVEQETKKLLQYYKFYFPEKPVPQVIALQSEFAVDAFTYGDSICGIGLDMFLGPDFPYYNPEIFPEYLRRQFTREHIPVRLAKVLAQNLAGPPSGNRLLDIMTHNGKILYITASMLPDTHDSLIMGYSGSQWAGCVANEQQVWARLLDENLLFETDYKKIRKLVEPSPDAPMVFSEAPGEIGNWVGWQIVRAFMERNPDTTMQGLLEMNDAQKLLENARYKPRRR